MDDQEYEQIRAQRLQQLQQQSAANQKVSSSFTTFILYKSNV